MRSHLDYGNLWMFCHASCTMLTKMPGTHLLLLQLPGQLLHLCTAGNERGLPGLSFLLSFLQGLLCGCVSLLPLLKPLFPAGTMQEF